MAMVDVGPAPRGGLTAQVGWLGLKVGGRLAWLPAFVRWTMCTAPLNWLWPCYGTTEFVFIIIIIVIKREWADTAVNNRDQLTTLGNKLSTLKSAALQTYYASCSIPTPISRPYIAPIAMLGMNRPAGTCQPNHHRYALSVRVVLAF